MLLKLMYCNSDNRPAEVVLIVKLSFLSLPLTADRFSLTDTMDFAFHLRHNRKLLLK